LRQVDSDSGCPSRNSHQSLRSSDWDLEAVREATYLEEASEVYPNIDDEWMFQRFMSIMEEKLFPKERGGSDPGPEIHDIMLEPEENGTPIVPAVNALVLRSANYPRQSEAVAPAVSA
jgi:hypothetical protein